MDMTDLEGNIVRGVDYVGVQGDDGVRPHWSAAISLTPNKETFVFCVVNKGDASWEFHLPLTLPYQKVGEFPLKFLLTEIHKDFPSCRFLTYQTLLATFVAFDRESEQKSVILPIWVAQWGLE